MPRKQRFKPSRKPKPAPQIEVAATDAPVHNPAANTNRVDTTAAPRPNDEDSRGEPKSEQ